MKIITDQNNLVLYADEEAELTSTYAKTNGSYDCRLNDSNATIHEVAALPSYYQGACFTYTPEAGFIATAYGRAQQAEPRRAKAKVVAEEKREQELNADALLKRLQNTQDTDAYIENCDEATRIQILKLLVKKVI